MPRALGHELFDLCINSVVDSQLCFELLRVRERITKSEHKEVLTVAIKNDATMCLVH